MHSPRSTKWAFEEDYDKRFGSVHVMNVFDYIIQSDLLASKFWANEGD